MYMQSMSGEGSSFTSVNLSGGNVSNDGVAVSMRNGSFSLRTRARHASSPSSLVASGVPGKSADFLGALCLSPLASRLSPLASNLSPLLLNTPITPCGVRSDDICSISVLVAFSGVASNTSSKALRNSLTHFSPSATNTPSASRFFLSCRLRTHFICALLRCI